MIATFIGIAFMLSLLNHFGVINALTGGRLGGEGARTGAQVEVVEPGVP
jgi:hypothetical protein